MQVKVKVEEAGEAVATGWTTADRQVAATLDDLPTQVSSGKGGS